MGTGVVVDLTINFAGPMRFGFLVHLSWVGWVSLVDDKDNFVVASINSLLE